MNILIEGKRGEGKSTVALILYRALVKRGYNVYSKIEGGEIDIDLGKGDKADITITEVFQPITNNKED